MSNPAPFVDFNAMDTNDLVGILQNLVNTIKLSIDDYIDKGPGGMGSVFFWLYYPTIQEITLILINRGINVFQQYPLVREISHCYSK